MAERFAPLFRQQLDFVTRLWLDEIYADRRTDLPSILSSRELVEFLPDVLEELARLLDQAAGPVEIAEAAKRLRAYPQVRFQQGVLVDELARELMHLRGVLNDVFWREGISASGGDVRELRDALRRTNIFIDELHAQTVLTYAASLRPRVRTRDSVWPPPRRRRKSDLPDQKT